MTVARGGDSCEVTVPLSVGTASKGRRDRNLRPIGRLVSELSPGFVPHGGAGTRGSWTSSGTWPRDGREEKLPSQGITTSTSVIEPGRERISVPGLKVSSEGPDFDSGARWLLLRSHQAAANEAAVNKAGATGFCGRRKLSFQESPGEKF